jgi:hypothetical protein
MTTQIGQFEYLAKSIGQGILDELPIIHEQTIHGKTPREIELFLFEIQLT